MAFYNFQLSGVHCLEPRSRRGDVSLVSFGVLVNKREQGRGTALAPFWRGTQLRGKEISEAARMNGYPVTARNMTEDWEIGPVQVDEGDSVDVILTVTNTADSSLSSVDQQKIDEWTIKALNIYYSWLLGNFVSAFGLSYLQDFATGSGAVTAFLTNPVGELLGYERSGPCNGVVLRDVLHYGANDLAVLNYAEGQSPRQGVSTPLHYRMAVLQHSYIGSEEHNLEGCGPEARTEVEVAVRRYPYWSWEHFLWEHQASARRRFPSGGSMKVNVGIRW